MAGTGHLVGRVVKAHGLRGGLVARPASDGSDVLLGVEDVTLALAGRSARLHVATARWLGKQVLLDLEGVGDRNAAEGWVGAEVLVDELPPPSDGEYYVAALQGLPVVTPAGQPVGKVVDLEAGGPQDWLVVERDGRRHLVPFAEPLVRIEEDPARVVLDAPEGLFDL